MINRPVLGYYQFTVHYFRLHGDLRTIKNTIDHYTIWKVIQLWWLRYLPLSQIGNTSLSIEIPGQRWTTLGRLSKESWDYTMDMRTYILLQLICGNEYCPLMVKAWSSSVIIDLWLDIWGVMLMSNLIHDWHYVPMTDHTILLLIYYMVPAVQRNGILFKLHYHPGFTNQLLSYKFHENFVCARVYQLLDTKLKTYWYANWTHARILCHRITSYTRNIFHSRYFQR